ncbi:11033_t:CDS:1 [Paraglomus occultum]|uniref:11033_t:CDS:1 n=1 Tax=Paraglomus occultum TaxID=144539 RepID=A0A9N9B5C2_9GLOM|nr:11033_t:CDS:1 [Paraglomus occultum]
MNNEQYQQIVNVLSYPAQRHPVRIRRQAQEYELENDMLMRIWKNEWKTVIKRDQMNDLLYYVHNHPMAGHFGKERTLMKLQESFWWPRMEDDVNRYIDKCENCQREKKAKRSEPLRPIPITGLFEHWGIDLVGPVNTSKNGHTYMIVAIDYFSKWAEVAALSTKDASSVVAFVTRRIICRHGIPSEITTDNGAEFVNSQFESLCKKNRIKQIKTTPYHPQGNGLVERYNQTLVRTLRKILDGGLTEWDNFIAPATFAYNTSVQSSTKSTPYYLAYGKEARTPDKALYTDKGSPDDIEYRIGQIISLNSDRQRVSKRLVQQQIRQKRHYDAKIQEGPYRPGDIVWLDQPAEGQWQEKLELRAYGPYEIVRRNRNGKYKIRHKNTGNTVDKWIHGDKLFKAVEDSWWKNEPVVAIEYDPERHKPYDFPPLQG